MSRHISIYCRMCSWSYYINAVVFVTIIKWKSIQRFIKVDFEENKSIIYMYIYYVFNIISILNIKINMWYDHVQIIYKESIILK